MSATSSNNTKYDVIIVGAGAGGGVIAGILAEAGKRVLLLERGRPLTFEQVGRDHLRNMRLSQYGVNAGPDGADHPRVYVSLVNGEPHTVLPHQGEYHNNAATVGSGTLVYGAQAWRFHPLDFKMASTYGIPHGSSLADWPIGYDDLAPFYERAEHELGVAGDSAVMSHLPTYNRDYPMPPLPINLQGQIIRRGAKSLGWNTMPIPLAVNTESYNNRPACIRCQHCVGFACPVDAKNGTQNTLIPRALLSGRCDLITRAMVSRVVTTDGRATGIEYFDAEDNLQTVTSDVIVLAGGAIESARLLLNSRLGNADHVGRHLQGHYYPTAIGLFKEIVQDGQGPGVSTAVTHFNHGNDGIVGGGMLGDEFTVLPIIHWKRMLPPDLVHWGSDAKDWMRENYRRVLDIKGPVQEIPHPDSRVTVDPDLHDRWGIPVVRLSGATHSATVRTAQFMHERAKEWLIAAGAIRIWGNPPSTYLSGGQHQSGTCRMGDDPISSVVDRHCRLHGHDNLYIGDGGAHVTNGGFNPFLTIMALAYRTAEHIKASW